MILVSQNMEFIRLTISQPFLKIKTSGLDPKNFSKISCGTFHHVWGHQVHFWSHGLAPTFLLKESAKNFAKVSSRLPQQTVLLDSKRTLDL